MEQQAVYTTQAPQKRDDRRRYWWCPKCKNRLGRIMILGDFYALLRHGQITKGESWVRCDTVHDDGTKCDYVRHWVELRTNLPAFARRMGERSAAEAALFAEAEREIREKVQEER